jgi:lysophospholipase L1-like esterase
MLEQPCPVQAMPDAPKREPGEPARMTPEFGRAYGALLAYQQRYDWAGLCRYAAENEALKGQPATRTVFMGDSITEGWRRYDPALFSGGTIDRGISGQTTPQMVVRFYQDVVALRPRVVHIMAGTNDIAGNTGPTSAEQFRNNIRAMVDIAAANGIGVVLASITPISLAPASIAQRPPQRIVELNAWLKSYAASRGAVYADYYSAMAGPDGAVKDGLTFDGLHPGTLGYNVMRPIAKRAIAQAERKLIRNRRRP